MKKEKILEQIDELKQKIEVLEKKVNSPEFDEVKKGVRQRPKIGEIYYFLGDNGRIYNTEWEGSEEDLFRFNTGNCFKTEQEAEDYRENLLTKQQLKDLALELNNGVEINWENCAQTKFSIYYQGHHVQELRLDSADFYTQIGQVYCLDAIFLETAKERIGEEKLIKLIKSGV